MSRVSMGILLAIGAAIGIHPAAEAADEMLRVRAEQVAAGTASQSNRSTLSVYWVGHSLLDGKARDETGEYSIMTLVGRFAEARGLSYEMFDHTLWGSPLSAQWQGKPHSYERDATVLREKRIAFEQNAARYDTLVMTEGIPVEGALQNEYSPLYARSFYCALKSKNPAGRVYLYESWTNYHGDPHQKKHSLDFDWLSEMKRLRPIWDDLADQASKPAVRQPGLLSKVGLSFTTDAGCTHTDPIMIVPVGTTLVAIAERLKSPQSGDIFTFADGSPLAMTDFFANPYVKDATGATKLRDGSKDLDDIHASDIAIYVASLVHFATLYGENPIGLPFSQRIGQNLAWTLQRITWETVTSDPHSGVTRR